MKMIQKNQIMILNMMKILIMISMMNIMKTRGDLL